MNCEKIQESLYTLSIQEFSRLSPHLKQCKQCSALAESIRQAEQDIEADLNDFITARAFDPAFLTQEQPIQSRGNPMTSIPFIATTIAAAAVLSLSVFQPFHTSAPSDTELAFGTDTIVAAIDESLCQGLASLEPQAMMGKLEEDAKSCLMQQLHKEDLDEVTKDAVSRMLMVNAFANGNDEEWGELALNHLENISNKDLMLIIKYIILTAKKNGTSEDTVSWSLVALGQTQQTSKAANRLLPRITELHVLALQDLHTSGTWPEDKVREVAQTTRTLLKANHLKPNEELAQLCSEVGCE